MLLKAKAIKLNPNVADAYFNRGAIYEILQKYQQAIKDYTQAIKLNPNFAEAYQNRGNAYKALGKNAEAEKDFAKAKELGYKGWKF